MAHKKPAHLRRVKSGDVFGRLTVLNEEPKRGVSYRWKVRCQCGTVKVVYQQQLKRNVPRATVSCGCLARERSSSRLLKHGACRGGKSTPMYSTWSSMIARCHNPNSAGYGTHGGRGIVVCERWRSSFSAFLEDMGDKPSPAHSLDRIDNDGNYEPSNCRWATWSEQSRNTRWSRKLLVDGRLVTHADLAESLGLSRSALRSRLKKMTIEEAVKMPKYAKNH